MLFKAKRTSITIFFITICVLLNYAGRAEGNKENGGTSKVGVISEKNPTLYAVILDNDKRRLCAIGDIFCSEEDITDCLRIVNIEKHLIVLRSTQDGQVVLVKEGGRLPLKGKDLIFEKSIERNIIEFRYRHLPGKGRKGPVSEDFVVDDIAAKRIILEKGYIPDAGHTGDRYRKEGFFREEQLPADGVYKLKASMFDAVDIKKYSDDRWIVTMGGSDKVMEDVGRTLFSVIKSVRPEFRFGMGPSLRFTSEVGDVVINKEGFLVSNIAVAKIAEKAGIRQGDLIKSVNGRPVNSLYGIYKAYTDVRSTRGNKTIKLDIVRDGEEKTLFYMLR